ncbi:MAG: hypothetical protein ABIY70_04805 [Capsulimonas sp.]|uniref:hypothetical protein n=1 Tax=Capsulimonas sp. TaxID=2494211 RepID=UPI003264DE9B
MERPEYYAEKAKNCLASAYELTPTLIANEAPMIQAAAAMRSSYVAEAQVYATLALAATQAKAAPETPGDWSGSVVGEPPVTNPPAW